MNVMLAAFNLVHDYPGGAVALGPILGKSPATLSHEVKGSLPHAKFGLSDAVKLSEWTGDRRIAHAFAAQIGCMLVSLPDTHRAGTPLQALADMAREFAELVASVTEAASDNRVTRNELMRVEREAGELVASVQVTVEQLSAMLVERHGVACD